MTRVAGGLVVIVALLAWLWPIGIGGKMPIGGDVTNFFLGLMAVLGESLREGRLAVWNDLWGYGFPGVGESQMGVFYPPHVILYRFLDTETAYVASLVLHTLWGGLGVFWAGRKLGISGFGSTLAAFSWSTCGFYLIHLAHPWGYTTGSWMPWAFGLAWLIVMPGTARPGAPLLLSLVLALQLLPGHFQLAFLTEFTLVLIVVWAVMESFFARRISENSESTTQTTPQWRRTGGMIVAVAAMLPLAAMQLWPTARLATLAAGQRDFEYLSGFASTPFHLVNYVAPGLFHRSPFWRPLVWDPFHTSPEEHLAYIGLIPLFLAIMAISREWRRDPSIRLLMLLLFATLILSFGPYMPGFRLLITLPGFNFFRAPSRWSLVTALALALLAGKGFDRWQKWTRPGRSLWWLSLAAVGWLVVTLGVLELGLLSTARPGWPNLARQYQRAFDAMPWTGDPSFEAVVAQARRPMPDKYVPAALSPAVVLQKPLDGKSFANQRGWIYARELGETIVLLAVILVAARMFDRGRVGVMTIRTGLVLIAFADLWILGRHRLIEVAPLRPLTEQSPLLARLAKEPRGSRIADARFRNLPMLLGLAPLAAYRTLNLPAVPKLNDLAYRSLSEPNTRRALRATGTSLRVFDPMENRIKRVMENRIDRVPKRDGEPRETIEDPVLPGWIFDPAWVAEQGTWVHTFTIWRSEESPTRAWLVPKDAISDGAALDHWSGENSEEILSIFDDAQPLTAECSRPDEWTISVEDGDWGWVIVSQLDDRQWKARWIGLDGQGEYEVPVESTFRRGDEPGGWQRVKALGPGRWTLKLKYDARDVDQGLAISLIAWICWTLAAVLTASGTLYRRYIRTEATQTEA
jgi:hypothetical protein